jgi:hypothetical protein
MTKADGPNRAVLVLIAVTTLALLATGVLAVATWRGRVERVTGVPGRAVVGASSAGGPFGSTTMPGTLPPGAGVAAATPAPTAPPTTARATTTTLSPAVAGPFGPVTLTGCPPSYTPPPSGPPSHPSVLVPESALPTPPAPLPRITDLSVLSGKGMWIYQQSQTNGGDVSSIVRQAAANGLRQVWVRLGSSFDGFYGQAFLDALVPALHREGIAVIGWGFPYLYDPVADVAWTQQALDWRAPGGDRLDGWSADIETASEGTALSAKRSVTYLGLVRPLMDGRPLIATVFPPTDYWMANYPYQAMAPYIDAFAPMLYWSCVEPGAFATQALQNLRGLAPLHLIGQAYDMGPDGGRDGSPSPAEILRFLDVARRGGAIGASFWVWQDMTGSEWTALGSYPWAPTPPRAPIGRP